MLVLQTRTDTDCDMLHAAVQDRAWLLSLLEIEQQKPRNIKQNLTALQLRIMDHSSFNSMAHDDTHSDVRCRLEAGLRFMLSQAARRVWD